MINSALQYSFEDNKSNDVENSGSRQLCPDTSHFAPYPVLSIPILPPFKFVKLWVKCCSSDINLLMIVKFFCNGS